MTERTAIYRIYGDARELLYVGVSNDPTRRMFEHKARASWSDLIQTVYVEWVDSREQAMSAEARIIRDEHPKFNGGPTAYLPTGDILLDWMQSARIGQSDLAKSLGIKQPALSKIMNGNARASLLVAVTIEDMSKGEVPCRYWLKGSTIKAHGNAKP